MEELLKSLQKKCRVECEEAHRQLVCALNGLAGIHIIRGRDLLFFARAPSAPHFPRVQTKDPTRTHQHILCRCVVVVVVVVVGAHLDEVPFTAPLINSTRHEEPLFYFLPAGEFVEAAEMYREVLRSSEEHKDRLKTDSLQVNKLVCSHLSSFPYVAALSSRE